MAFPRPCRLFAGGCPAPEAPGDAGTDAPHRDAPLVCTITVPEPPSAPWYSTRRTGPTRRAAATSRRWWKGRGNGVDFFDPEARAWWHALQNDVLDAGLDDWKLDFGGELPGEGRSADERRGAGLAPGSSIAGSIGAMNAFMQLHARANLAPWTVPKRVDETIANYRWSAHGAYRPLVRAPPTGRCSAA